MGRLKDVESGEIAERRYVAKTFVYLESDEDVQILGVRWFNDRGAKVEFVPVGDDDQGGGCNEVLRKVEEDHANGVESHGIVDRDILASRSDWEAFFETDDDVFWARRPFGERCMSCVAGR
jgi:hypothetical protein